MTSGYAAVTPYGAYPTSVTVAIVDERAAPVGPPVATVAAALQQQLDRDFAPTWGISAQLVVVPARTAPPLGAWWLVLLDQSDGSDLGYHFVTSEGAPLGKVFCGWLGASWSATASHELLEMLGNPFVNRVVYDPQAGCPVGVEVCDPCELDTYLLGGVPVSDFVTPAWFGMIAPAPPYDRLRLIGAPFALRPGGSLFRPGGGPGPQRAFAAEAPAPYEMRIGLGSRGDKRRTPREHWLVSDVDRTKDRDARMAEVRDRASAELVRHEASAEWLGPSAPS